MKILLDENLPQKLRHGLTGHDVSTVGYLGWNGMKNGELLRAAEAEGFEVFVTGDQSLQHQQNLQTRKIALVVVSAIQWEILKDNLPQILEAVDGSALGSFREVQCSRGGEQRSSRSGGSV